MFVFYDTETTGRDVRHDQVLQVGIVTVDASLHETAAYDMRSRLLSHVVPDPQALAVTGLRPVDLERGMAPYDFAREWHRLFTRASDQTFIGYNSLRFDEEVARSTFWTNLLSPFVTSMDGNRRADLLRMVEAFVALRPGSLVVPLGDSGRRSLRLDSLAPANGYEDFSAHDALADVRATLYLANRLRAADPGLFEWLLSLGCPRSVDRVLDEGSLLWLFSPFPSPELRPIVPVAKTGSNRRLWACVDLSRPLDGVSDLSPSEMRRLMSDPESPLVLVRSNSQPVLFAELGPDVDRSLVRSPGAGADRALASLLSNPSVRPRLSKALESWFADPAITLEQQLYEAPFIQPGDRQAVQAFHDARTWEDRYRAGLSIEHPVHRQLALRIVEANSPGVAGPAADYNAVVARHRLLVPADAPFRGIEAAMQGLDGVGDGALREDLAGYLQSRLAECRLAVA